jgi:predicted molibdopterin-dependent oxidoreductase YjgC
MKQGAKICIINSVPTELDRFATFKAIIPENGAGAAAKILLKYALNNSTLKVEGFESLRASIKRGEQTIRAAEDTFGARCTTQLQQMAEEIVGATGAIILYDEMATLAPNCKNLAEDLQTLAILTNNVGRPGAGVGPLFEDANSLGARDMGLLPDALPGYQAPLESGLSYTEILSSPQVKALYVMGANPVRHASLPSGLDFVIVQDILLTETAQLADVVLPAVTFAEKDGSMTNVDHHIQAIRKALRPLPGAKADWEILTTLARSMGAQWTYASPRDIFLEIADSNPLYADLTWEDLGLQGIRTQEQEVAHV